MTSRSWSVGSSSTTTTTLSINEANCSGSSSSASWTTFSNSWGLICCIAFSVIPSVVEGPARAGARCSPPHTGSLDDARDDVPRTIIAFPLLVQKRIDKVLERLDWMRAEKIWPNGKRYLWTDAFGIVLLLSLYRELGDQRRLDDAHWLVNEVERVLARKRGIRIGDAPDRDRQYFH